MCLCVGITLPPIALGSCLNSQKTWKVSMTFNKRTCILFYHVYILLMHFTLATQQVIMHTLAAGLWIYHTWKSWKNQGYFVWLTNCIAPQPIALENCSNPEKTPQVFECPMKKMFVLGFGFYVSDIISKVGFWPFLAAGTWSVPNCLIRGS